MDPLPARRAALSAIAVCSIGLQLFLLASVMPLEAIDSTTRTFWFLDHPFHLYQIELGRQLLAHGQLVGYDPFFAAGYIGGVSFNASARVPVLLGMLAPGVATTVIYALYVAFCAATGPALLVWLAAQLRWSVAQAALVTVGGQALWWCSVLHWYHGCGMTSFVFCCFFSIPYAVGVWRLCQDEPRRTIARILLYGMLGGIGLWLHPLFAVLVGIFFVACVVVWRWGDRPVRFIARGTAVSLIGVGLALPWMLAMLKAPSIIFEDVVQIQREVGFHIIFGHTTGVPHGILSPMYFLAAATFLFGVFRRPRLHATWAYPFAVAGPLMLVFAAFGAQLNAVGPLQPNRFAGPGYLILTIGGMLVIHETLASDWRRWRGWGKCVVAVGCAVALAIVAREWVREATPGPQGRFAKGPPEMTDTPPLVQRVVDWIDANTTNEGRVLFETSYGRVFGGGHAASQVAWKTGRELMGGAYPFSQARLSFYDHTGFGKPLDSLSVDEIRRGFDLYNIGWIVAHSKELEAKLATIPFVHQAARFENVATYVVDRPLSFVVRGEARIEGRGFDHVDVTDASSNDLVLRYNWSPLLRTCPAARVEQAIVEPDFPPLVRIVNPPSRFTLTTSTQCSSPR